jgi:hypothetical protein
MGAVVIAAHGNEERQLHEPTALPSSPSAIGVACKGLSRLRLDLAQASFRFRPIHTLAKLDVPENVLALVRCGIQLVVGEVYPLRHETRLELNPVVSPEMIVHGIPLKPIGWQAYAVRHYPRSSARYCPATGREAMAARSMTALCRCRPSRVLQGDRGLLLAGSSRWLGRAPRKYAQCACAQRVPDATAVGTSSSIASGCSVPPPPMVARSVTGTATAAGSCTCFVLSGPLAEGGSTQAAATTPAAKARPAPIQRGRNLPGLGGVPVLPNGWAASRSRAR